MYWRRIFGLVIGFGLLTTLFSTSPAPIAQAHNPPPQSITITTCDGLLEKLNEVHGHDVVAVHNCQYIEQTQQIAAIIEFAVYNGPHNDQHPSGHGQGDGFPFYNGFDLPASGPYHWIIQAGAVFTNFSTFIGPPPVANYSCTFSPGQTADPTGEVNWPCSSEHTPTGEVNTYYNYVVYKDLKIKHWVYFPVPQPPPPTVEISADPPIIFPGQNTTLRWSSTNATTLSIDNGIGAVAIPSGSRQVGPINQDTTYKITATGPGGTAEAAVTVKTQCSVGLAPSTKKIGMIEIIKNRFRPPPALAQNSCAPDLEVDLSQIYGVKSGERQMPVALDNHYVDIRVKNIIIKNVGNGPSPAASLSVSDDCHQYADVGIPRIDPGQQVVVEELIMGEQIKFGDQILNCYSADNSGYDGQNDLRARVDIIEDSEQLNNADSKEFFAFPIVKVTVVDAKDMAVPEAQVTLSNEESSQSSFVHPNGKVSFSLLRPLPATYAIAVSWHGQRNLATTMAVITENKSYEYRIKIALKKSLIINPIPLMPDDDSPDLVKADGLENSRVIIQLQAGDGRIINKDVYGETPAITLDEFGTAKDFTIKSLVARYDFDYPIIKNGTITYQLAASQSTKKYILAELFSKNDIPKIDLEMQLPTDCYQGTPTIKFCIYDEPGEIAAAKAGYLKTFAIELTRLGNFPSGINLTATTNIWVVPYCECGGQYDSRVKDRLWYMGRLAKVDDLIARDLVIHEAMHALDDQIGVRRSKDYEVSASLTADGSDDGIVTETTGAWAWENLGHTCALFPDNKKNVCVGHFDPKDGSKEIFAEQITNICLGLPVAETLAKTSALWQEKNPGQSEPADLLAHRDIIASRSVGASSTQGLGWLVTKVKGLNPLTVDASQDNYVRALVIACAGGGGNQQE